MRIAFWLLFGAVLAFLLAAAFVRLADQGSSTGPVQARPQAGSITVEAVYPGANAQTVRDALAGPIEEQVSGTMDLVRLASRCRNDGTYTLHLTFKPGVDMNIAQVLVQNRVSLALPRVPREVQLAGISVIKQTPGMSVFLALFSPDNSRDTVYLSNYATVQVKDELARLPGVARVTLFGGSEYGMRVWLDPEKLAVRELTASEVFKALQEQKGLDGEQLADLVVKSGAGGRTIRLKDVASVELGASRSPGFARLDGKPVVALGVSALPKASPLEVSAAVRARAAKLKPRFPEGIDYSLAFDLTTGSAGCVLVEPTLPPGMSADQVLRFVDRAEALVRETEGVQHTLSLSENPFARFHGGPCILALLTPDAKPEGRDKVVHALRTRLEKVAGAQWGLGDLAERCGFPVDLALRGPEVKDVRELSEKLVERLARTKKLTDVAASQSGASERQLDVDIDRAAAAAAGVSMLDINNTLQISLGSAQAGDLARFGRNWKVQVQLAERARDSAEAIKRLMVRNAKGEMIPLSKFAKVREVTGPAHLDRLDLLPMVEITANPARAVSLGEARWLCESLAEEIRKELRLSTEYRLVWLQELPAAKPIAGAGKTGAAEPAPPEVAVIKPVEREVTDYEECTGRTDAVDRVEVKARVSGYIVRTPFKEGSEVKKGEVLFEIDPRPYQAQLDQAAGRVALAVATLRLARATLARDRKLAEAVPGSITPQQLDQDTAAMDEAEARVKAAQAGIEVAKLNLDFCKITAPIDGRVSRYYLTMGNLAQADQTTLTSIVSLDPVHVYFDVDEVTLLRLHRLIADGKVKPAAEGTLPGFVGLAGETGFPHKGTIDFVNNQVDPGSGTIRMRLVLANPGPVRLLTPGLFARVRLPLGPPHQALLVPEEAIGNDQGLKFVYVVDDQNKVVSRRVTVGQAQDGLRVIKTGLRPGEWVIRSGPSKVRPGLTVKPRSATGS